MTRPHVLILHVGGTIGMRRTPSGYGTHPGHLAELLQSMPELQRPELPAWDLHEFDPLLDSAEMTPDDWLRIAETLVGRQNDYDGFVVLHGTDTMAYTAAALDRLLLGVHKPVVLTGSQIPLFEVRNDARENLINALTFAATPDLHEVCIAFDDVLLRASTATKVSSFDLHAFDAPNAAPLAHIGVNVRWTRPPTGGAQGPMHLRPHERRRVLSVRLYPGLTADMLTNVLQDPIDALILEMYGAGNGPRDPDLLAALEAAHARGVRLVAVSQTPSGGVNLADYETGQAYARVGVESWGRATTEAALAALTLSDKEQTLMLEPSHEAS